MTPKVFCLSNWISGFVASPDGKESVGVPVEYNKRPLQIHRCFSYFIRIKPREAKPLV